MPARDAHTPSFSVGSDSWAPRRHLLLLARVPPDYIFFCGGAKAPRTAGFDHMAPLSDTIRCTDPLPMPHGGSRLRSLRHPWSMGAIGGAFYTSDNSVLHIVQHITLYTYNV